MNNLYTISVIIPIYNVEKYLSRCLNSVLLNSDDSIEIICVNDGSVDNSREIILDFKKRYPQIKHLDRTNGGLSAARNTGIKVALGEFILFLDSDDWLETDVLNRLFYEAKNNDVDVLIANTKWIYENNTIKLEKYNSYEIIDSVMPGSEAIIKLMENDIYVPMVYNYLYRRSYINSNNFEFVEGLIYEDELWTPMILINAKRVTATNIYHYNYFQHENTITNSDITINKIESAFFVSKELLKLINKKDNKTLVSYIWKRSCVVYNKALNMLKSRKYDINQSFKIYWTDLFTSGMNYESFNFCLGQLTYNKMQKRIFRVLFLLINK